MQSDSERFVKCLESGRLAWYRQSADAAFWDELWADVPHEELYGPARNGNLSPFEKVFTKYLPRDGRILEAGCGLGQLVLALRARGYSAEGVDFATNTVQSVRARFPDLPIRESSVLDLDVPDRTYSAYISIGVVEHRQAGPEPFLLEARRVLKPDGVALISVPCLTALRRLKGSLGCYRGRAQGLDFYQYAFATREFDTILKKCGFRVLTHHYYAGFAAIQRETPLIRAIASIPYFGIRLNLRAIRYRVFDNRACAHMMMAVCSPS